MEKPNIEQKEVLPQSVEEAVELYTGGKLDEDGAVAYLRSNKNQITEFCLQTYEAYSEGDKSGIIKLGMILEKAL